VAQFCPLARPKTVYVGHKRFLQHPSTLRPTRTTAFSSLEVIGGFSLIGSLNRALFLSFCDRNLG
jgi:hypothetical protein